MLASGGRADHAGPNMTAPQQRAGGLDANARGIVVLAVAVLVGLLLLLKTGGNEGASAVTATGNKGGVTTSAPLGSTTTTPDDTTTTTTASGAHQPSAVKVLVLNGSGLTGVAKTNSSAVGAKGYKMLTAGNAPTTIPTTVVYYAAGYQEDATAVATALGKTSSVVKAMPSTPPGPGADQANVVVVLGKDTAP